MDFSFGRNLSGQAFSTRFFPEKEKRAQTIASILCAEIVANNIPNLKIK
tara:strand:+ start:325 stop:471 length:147 start_codon:yes stop_codon:yes gene_type:complete